MDEQYRQDSDLPFITKTPRPGEPPTDPTLSLITERGKTHGDFTEHSLITQNIKLMMSANGESQQIKWQELRPYQREALEMIAHKIGRILAGDPDFRDHWDDIAGYARLVAERCTK